LLIPQETPDARIKHNSGQRYRLAATGSCSPDASDAWPPGGGRNRPFLHHHSVAPHRSATIQGCGSILPMCHGCGAGRPTPTRCSNTAFPPPPLPPRRMPTPASTMRPCSRDRAGTTPARLAGKATIPRLMPNFFRLYVGRRPRCEQPLAMGNAGPRLADVGHEPGGAGSRFRPAVP